MPHYPVLLQRAFFYYYYGNSENILIIDPCLIFTQDYYRSGRMLVKLAEAIGRLVLAGRELTRLAGFTARVQELLTVLKELNVGQYQRTMVENRTSSGGYSCHFMSILLTLHCS